MNKQISERSSADGATPIVLAAMLCFLATSLPALAQYRPIDLPKNWTFTTPTVAFDPENPQRKLGDFQAGIKVDILGETPDRSRWLVSYKRYGQPADHFVSIW